MDEFDTSEDLRDKRLKRNKSKELGFSFMCLLVGVLSICGIGLTVTKGAKWFISTLSLPPTIVYAEACDGTEEEINLDDPNVDAYYDENGQLYVDVTVEDEVVDTALNTDQEKTTEVISEELVTSESITDQEESTELNTQEPDNLETTQKQDDVKPADQEKITDNKKIDKELEKQLLADMNSRIQQGESGYLSNDNVYVVKNKDTLTKISNMTGFSIDFLAEYNHIKNRNLIVKDESIRYPKL